MLTSIGWAGNLRPNLAITAHGEVPSEIISPSVNLNQLHNQLQENKSRLEQLRLSQNQINRRLKAAGLTTANGIYMLKVRGELPPLWPIKNQVKLNQQKMASLQLLLLDLEESGVKGAGHPRKKLIEQYKLYFEKLADLAAIQQSIVSESQLLLGHINQNILWIQSTAWPRFSDFNKVKAGLWWILGPKAIQKMGHYLGRQLLLSPFLYLLLIFYLVLGLFIKKRIWVKFESLLPHLSWSHKVAVLETLYAFFLSLLLAAWRPFILLFFAWIIEHSLAAPGQVRSLAAGLKVGALVFFSLDWAKILWQDKGIIESIYQIDLPQPVAFAEKIKQMEFIMVPLATLTGAIHWQSQSIYINSIGRLLFLLGMLALAIYGHWLLVEFKGVLSYFVNKNRWWNKKWYLISWGMGVILPLFLATLAFVGYYHTARELLFLLFLSIWFVGSLLLLYATLAHWLNIYRKKVEQQQEKISTLAAFDTQLKKLVKIILIISLVAGLAFIWKNVLPAFKIFNHVVIYNYQTIEQEKGIQGEMIKVARDVPITLAHLLLAGLLIFLTFFMAKNLPPLLEGTLLQLVPLDHGGRYALCSVFRYTIIIVGIVSTLTTVGIAWEDIHWLVAAVSVGLGFGLQEIFANFISGLIIFIERPIRVGDTVTIGNISGTVTRIRIRATTIRDWDRKELIVPNKEFITGQLINWSLSDTVLRLEIKVGIAYGSDTKLARKLLLEIAQQHRLILSDPEPQAFFMSFGDNTLDFSMRVYINDIDNLLQVRHELHEEIDRLFRDANIEIAFPQRDLHIRTCQTPLPVKIN